MPHDVRGEFGRDDAHSASGGVIELCILRETLCPTAALAAVGLLCYRHARLSPAEQTRNHFQRVTETRVPAPTTDLISNSLTRRRAPDNPNPMPVPELQPSVSASSRFGMPGPVSSNVSLTPFLTPSCSTSHFKLPPPP